MNSARVTAPRCDQVAVVRNVPAAALSGTSLAPGRAT